MKSKVCTVCCSASIFVGKWPDRQAMCKGTHSYWVLWHFCTTAYFVSTYWNSHTEIYNRAPDKELYSTKNLIIFLISQHTLPYIEGTRETTFGTSCLPSCALSYFWKGVYCKRKEFAPQGEQISFLLKGTPFQTGGKSFWQSYLPWKWFHSP